MRITTVPSLLYRGVSLGAKFLLLVIMARYLPLEDIGRYGLAVATVQILSRVAGAEFYAVTNRELVSAGADERWRIVNTTVVVVGSGLLLAVPVTWMTTRVLDLGLGWPLLALILVTNQVGMETGRVLIAVGRPVRSYLVGALVNGLWPLGLIALWLIRAPMATLDSVWWAWVLGSGCGAAWGVVEVTRAIDAPWHSGTRDMGWVRRSLGSAGLFLLGAAALRTIEFADRFIVEIYLGTAAVGVYTYYSSFAKLVVELPSVLVVSPMFPEIVSVVRSGTRERARRVLGAFVRRCVRLALMSVPLLFGGLWLVADQLERPEIWAAPEAYFVVLVAGVFLAASYGGHYALYGARRDGTIAILTLAAAAVNVGIGLALTPVLGMPGAALGTLGAMASLAAVKEAFGRRVLAVLPGGDHAPIAGDGGTTR